MKNKKPNDVTRSALWTAYNFKCFYCCETLDWNDVNIDHIIPESEEQDQRRLDDLKNEFGLPKDFEINDIRNLVPCHARCNREKSDFLFRKASLDHILLRVDQHINKVQKEIETRSNRRNKGKILANISAAISTGLLTEKELAALTEDIKQNKWKELVIKLPDEVSFFDEVYDTFYLHEDYDFLLDKTLLVNGNDDVLRLTNDFDAQKEASTLRQWRIATSEGYYPYSTVGIKASSAFTFLDEFLVALKNASMPKYSFISDPWIGLSDLHLLSPALIFHPDNEEIKLAIQTGETVKDLVDAGMVSIAGTGINSVALEYSGMETYLIEQFRADFNKDGIEDIFVKGWVRAVGGTFGHGFTEILTKYSDTHLIAPIGDRRHVGN